MRLTLLTMICLLHNVSLAWADGGTLRLSEHKGDYRITVFTSPTAMRAGPVDVSVLVQDATTGELTPGVRVIITVGCRDSSHVVFHGPATTEAATNKLYYS